MRVLDKITGTKRKNRFECVFHSKKLYIKACVCFIISAFIFCTNFYVVKRVWSIDLVSYSRTTEQQENIILSGNGLYTPFIPVTNKIDSLNIGKFLNYPADAKVEIYIVDYDDIYIWGQILSVQDCINEGNMLEISVADIDFDSNQTYKLLVYPHGTDGIEVGCINNNQVLIQQIYPFEGKKIVFAFIILIDALFAILMVSILLKKNTVRVMICLSLVLGTCTSFIIVPCVQSAGDEYRHFLRAYDIAQGNARVVLSEYSYDLSGNALPVAEGMFPVAEVPAWVDQLKYVDTNFNILDKFSYTAEINRHTNLAMLKKLLLMEDNGEKYKVALTATWSNSILAYIPQVIAILIGRLMNIDNILIFYLARLGNVLASTLLFYISLRLGERYKAIICMIHFLPLNVFLRGTCQPDAIVSSLTMLLGIYILYIKENDLSLWKAGRFFKIAGMAAVLAIIKLPYIITLALVMLLRNENIVLISKRLAWWKAFAIKFIVFCSLFFISLAAYKTVSGYETALAFSECDAEVESEASLVGGEHIDYILENPGKVVQVFVGEFWNSFEKLKNAIKGDFFESRREALFEVYGNFYLLVFLVVCFGGKVKMKWKDRILLLLTYTALVFLVILVAYTWQSPDAGYIWGISPRYYLPVAFLLPLALGCGNDRMQKKIEGGLPYCLIGGNWILCLMFFKLFIL